MVPYGAERAANELLSTNIKIIVSLGGGGGKDIPPPPPGTKPCLCELTTSFSLCNVCSQWNKEHPLKVQHVGPQRGLHVGWWEKNNSRD